MLLIDVHTNTALVCGLEGFPLIKLQILSFRSNYHKSFPREII